MTFADYDIRRRNMKKLISVLLAIAIVLPIFCVHAAAYDASSMRVWDGTADTSWYTGNSDSYDISTPEQLAGMSKLVNEGTCLFKGVTINLTADILMNDNPGEWEDWKEFPPANKFTAIGYTQSVIGNDQPFMGGFNGHGHTISGLYTDGELGGLFGYISGAVIANVRVYKSCLTGKRTVARNGFAGGIAALSENCYISNCEVDSCFVGAKGPSSNDGMHDVMAGGIIGSAQTNNVAGIASLMTIGAMGIMINPAIMEGASGGAIASTIIDSCKVIRTSVKAQAEYGSAMAGGLIGYGHTGKMYDSIYILGGGTVNAAGGNGFGGKKYGLVAGQLFNYHLQNVYYYVWDESIKTWGVGSYEHGMFEQKDTSLGKTEAEIKAAEFAETLGDAYEAVSNDYPRLKVMGELPKFKDSGIKRLDAPSNINAVPDDVAITLSWDAVSGADSYIVKYSTDRKTWLAIETKTTSCDIPGLTPEKKYYYSVQAVKDGVHGRHSEIGNVKTLEKRQPAPTNVRCINRGMDYVTIKWDGPLSYGNIPSGTSSYHSFGISTDKENWTYYNAQKYSAFTVKNLTPGTTYYFKIALCYKGLMGRYNEPVAFRTVEDESEVGTAKLDDLNSGYTSRLSVPTNVRCTQKGLDNIRIEWDSDAAMSGLGPTIRKVAFTVAVSTDNVNWKEYDAYKKYYFDAKKLQSNTTYYFAVLLRDKDGRGHYSEPIAVTTKKDPSVNYISDCKIKLSKTSVVYNGKAQNPSVTVTKNDKTLKKGTDYTVSYKNNKNIGTATVTITGKGKYDGTKVLTFKINPPKQTIKSLISASKGQFKVTCKKFSGADGYQIRYSTKSSMSTAYKKSTSETSLTVNGLKSGVYYVQVRTYKVVDNTTYYGAWSEVKSVSVE